MSRPQTLWACCACLRLANPGKMTVAAREASIRTCIPWQSTGGPQHPPDGQPLLPTRSCHILQSLFVCGFIVISISCLTLDHSGWRTLPYDYIALPQHTGCMRLQYPGLCAGYGHACTSALRLSSSMRLRVCIFASTCQAYCPHLSKLPVYFSYGSAEMLICTCMHLHQCSLVQTRS